MIQRSLFSNAKEDWSTPRELYASLDAEFKFTLDPCPLGALGTATSDGLLRDWAGERVYCNPPYGGDIVRWLRRSREAAVAVYLLPSRTDTKWWHNWAMLANEVRFVRGRLRFGEAKNSAPFPSVILVFINGHSNGNGHKGD